jgi:putative DNA primase/helicase
MTAETIAKALGGRKAGCGWTARCPAHDDHTPSLSIRDAEENKVLVRCHAGCDQERVIAALRGRGLWAEKGPRSPSPSRVARRTHLEHKPDQDERSEIALAIWQSAKPARGTPVETYLASVGGVVPYARRHRLRRSRHQWTPGDLADPRQGLSALAGTGLL